MNIMVIKQLSLVSCLLVYALQCVAAENNDITGKYITKSGGMFEIAEVPETKTIALKYGHQTQIANVEINQNGYCFMLDAFDIIYPFDLSEKSTVSCLGGTAIVVSEGDTFELYNGKEIGISKIKVNRYGEVTVNNKTYSRPGGAMVYFLYLSEQQGLVGIDLTPDKSDAIYRKSR